jgi:hypothetical protein
MNVMKTFLGAGWRGGPEVEPALVQQQQHCGIQAKF